MRLFNLLILGVISATHVSARIQIHAMHAIMAKIIFGELPQIAPILKDINGKSTLDDWCVRRSDSPICEKITKSAERILACPSGNEYFPAGMMVGDVKLLSRFDVECRRSHYQEPGCRRRLREMVALVVMDSKEDAKKRTKKVFAVRQMMLELAHAGYTFHTFHTSMLIGIE